MHLASVIRDCFLQMREPFKFIGFVTFFSQYWYTLPGSDIFHSFINISNMESINNGQFWGDFCHTVF